MCNNIIFIQVWLLNPGGPQAIVDKYILHCYLFLLLSQMTRQHFHHFKVLCYCAICYDMNLHKIVRQAELDTSRAYLFVT